MAAIPKNFYRAKAPAETAPANVTVPTGKRWIITNVVAMNPNTAAAKVSVNVSGISLVGQMNVGPGHLFTLDCSQVIEAGQVVAIAATTGDLIAVHISGVEMDVTA